MSNGTRKENSKLPVRRESSKLHECYEQPFFDAEINPSDIIFSSGLTPPTHDSFFSPLGHTSLSSKKETMESPVLVESPPVDAAAGDYASGNFAFTSLQEKINVPSGSKKKRKHATNASEEEHDEIKSQLVSLLENNSRILAAHVQAQNINSQLDRDQRKEQADSLVAVLGKLADALEKLAEKI